MAAVQHRIIELNAQTLAKTNNRLAAGVALNDVF
jgi:hypothetical protein